MLENQEYETQCAESRERLIGEKVDGLRITEVGEPISSNHNCPSLVPVRLADGTYRVLWDNLTALVSRNLEVNEAIRTSSQMPHVAAGIGSDVLHIQTYPPHEGIKHSFMKCYYNSKSDRSDTVAHIPV